MMEIMQMLAGAGTAPPHRLPARVQTALQFAAMMRGTACRHLDDDADPAVCGLTTVCKSPPERDAYAAAMECLRTFFNGENGFEEPRTSPEKPDRDDPPPGLGAVALPPSPTAGPTAATPAPAKQQTTRRRAWFGMRERAVDGKER